MPRALLPTLLCLLALVVAQPAPARPLLVLAAASTVDAMQALADRFEADSGIAVTLSTAASSRLARQIERGAPADLFLSASPAWMDYLDSRALLLRGSRQDLLGNHLALLVPHDDRGVPALNGDTDVAALLGADRLVVAEPTHVPVGIYAREAFVALGLWPRLQGHLVYAPSARGVIRLLSTGQSRFGVAYATDARVSPRVRIGWLFPPALHSPIVYPMALLPQGDRPAARRLHRFLLQREAAAVFARYGFRHLPTGTEPAS